MDLVSKEGEKKEKGCYTCIAGDYLMFKAKLVFS